MISIEAMNPLSDLRLKILTILSDDSGHLHGEISKQLPKMNPRDMHDSSTEGIIKPTKKRPPRYDKGDLSKTLDRMRNLELIYSKDMKYYIFLNENAFSYIMKHSIKNGGSSEFISSFLKSQYVNNIIKTLGFKAVISAMCGYLDENRSFRDTAATALLSHSATIEEFKGLPRLIEDYFNSMENPAAMAEVGKNFLKDSVEVKRSSPAYAWMRKAFNNSIQQHDGAPYDNKVGNIEELEILHDLGTQGVLFYREHLLGDLASLFESSTNAEIGKHIIKYVQQDNYLSPFTAYPVSHPIELMFSSSFGRLYEDVYLIDPKDMGFLVERANTVFRNFAKFSHLYIGSRTYKEAAIWELIHDWNMASARLEAILGLLGQVGYDPEKSCFHLTRDLTGFQIVDMRTHENLLGGSDNESLEVANLNLGFYGFDQTKFMRPVILGSLGHEWQEQLVPVETIIAGMEIDS